MIQPTCLSAGQLRQPGRLAQKCRTLLAAGAVLLSGCQLSQTTSELNGPAVSTRFTANPLADESQYQELSQSTATVPNLKVGLTMQSGHDPVHSHFASNLGTALMRELQLSSPTLQLEPLVSLQPRTLVPFTAPQSDSGIISVGFSNPQDTLPPTLPPSPLFHSEAAPIVDQILVVRVLEYRPYYPLRATLEIRVLDGETQDPIFVTTATWFGEEYHSEKKKPTLRQKLFHRVVQSGPSPNHNSPQALTHEIAADLATWYHRSSTQLIVGSMPPERTWKDRWRELFIDDSCPPSNVNSCPAPVAMPETVLAAPAPQVFDAKP